MKASRNNAAKTGLLWVMASLAASCSDDLHVEAQKAETGGGGSTGSSKMAGNGAAETGGGGTISSAGATAGGGKTSSAGATAGGGTISSAGATAGDGTISSAGAAETGGGGTISSAGATAGGGKTSSTGATAGGGTTTGSGSADSGGSSAATCTDAIRNGDEADVDCGGSACPPCSAGQGCNNDDDCDTAVCAVAVCAAPDCFDGVLNGDETDVDCGGDDCNACPEGKACQRDDDCEWQNCDSGRCQQEPEVCDCDVSDALQILRCGSDNTQVYSPDPFLMAHDGSVVIFQRCVPISPTECMTMEVYRWEMGAGLQLVASDALAKGLSRDGQTLLVQAGDMRALMLVSPDGTETIPLDGAAQQLSADGSTFIANVHPYGDSEAQRWTLAGGLDALPGIPDAGGRSYARDISADGSVIVGYAMAGSAILPVIWSADRVEAVDTLVNNALSARALAVSADGSTMVGLTSEDAEASLGSAVLDIFRWTEADGMVAIGAALPPGIWGDGERLMVNEDGRVVAGTLNLEAGFDYPGAFRWSQAEGLTYLRPGGASYLSISTSMDATGDVIVGMLDDWSSGPTFVWEAGTGAVELATRLEDAGVSIEGWAFEGAAEVSGDGRVVAGIGLCGGTPAVYRAVLDDD
jgi:hypothetical protein